MSDIDRLESLVLGFGLAILAEHKTDGWEAILSLLSTVFIVLYLIAVWVQIKRRRNERP